MDGAAREGATSSRGAAGRARGDGTPSDGRARRPRYWLRRLLAVVVAGAIVGLVAVGVAAFAFWRIYDTADIPNPDQLAIPDPTIVLDTDDEPIATLQPAAVRRNVALEDIPDHVPEAILAAEDRGFYTHNGIQPTSIVRAAWANVTAGATVQGASTIPQQYVELAIEEIDASYLGKFREAATAVRLDRELSKDAILTNYLNAVPFGRNARGIEAASQTYFDIAAEELDLNQAATLAGMIAAPTAFDPARNPSGATTRRDFVLEGMVTTGAIDRATADEVMASELPELRDSPLFTYGPDAYFLDAVQEQLPDLLDEGVDPSSGLVIRTTMNQRAQRLALETANEQLADTGYSAAIVTIASRTGAVQALTGGLDFETEQVNVATNTNRNGIRQVGSTFKTFALAELVERGYDPDRTFLEGPAERTFEIEGREDYRVRNFGGAGYGTRNVRENTVDSVNTAYVELAQELGFESVVAMAETLGIRTPLEPNPSAVLGGESATPLDMAAAYATFSAEGVRHRPFLVRSIETADGEVLHEHTDDGDQVIDENTAAVVTDVLVDAVERGTGTAARTSHPVAGKTGTSTDSRDAWFVGYTPTLATAVWVGERQNRPMGDVTGGSFPAAIFGEYIGALVEGRDPDVFPTPDTSVLEPFAELPPPPPPPPPPPEEEDEEDEEEGDDEDAGEDDDAGDEDAGEDDGDTDGGDDGDDGDDGDTDDGGDDGDGTDDGSDDGTDDGDDDGTDDGSDDGGDDTGDDGTGDDGTDGGTEDDGGDEAAATPAVGVADWRERPADSRGRPADRRGRPAAPRRPRRATRPADPLPAGGRRRRP